MNTHSRIGRVKMKKGADLKIFTGNNNKTIRIPLHPYGEVVCTMFDDDENILPRDALWMMEQAKQELLEGNFT